VVILLVISFLISGSEVAFFSLSSKDLNLIKTKKNPSFKRIVQLLENPANLQATLHIANMFISIAVIVISNTLIEEWFKHVALHATWLLVIKILIITFVLVLFMEVLPKVWARQHKIIFAANASFLIQIINRLLFKFSNRVLRFSSGTEQRLSGKTKGKGSEDSLDNAIDLLPETEATTEEKQILKGIQKFSGTTVKQIMRSRLDVSGIELMYNFEELMNKVKELNYSRLPVYKNNLDEIIGIVHTKDLLPYLNETADFDWKQLIRQPYFVHEQKLIEDLLQEFRNERKHFAVVVDEFGGTSGIVTLEDIMEEIIGEIEDEFDEIQNANTRIDEYNYIFEGRTMIPDACRLMKIPLDTFDHVRGDSDSIAGLVLEIARALPQVNEKVISGAYTFIPLEINKNRIDKIKVIINPVQTDVAG
jgi:gliding motility-associated protein GldE